MKVCEYHTNLIVLIISSIFITMMIAVTYCSHDIVDLNGTVGIIDHADLWNSVDPLTAAIYSFGDWGCHQRIERSFVLGSSQMPFCIRETMIVAGVVIGSFILHIIPKLCNKPSIAMPVSILIALSALIEWLVQETFGLNILFFVGLSGILTGIGGTFTLYCLIKIEVAYLDAHDNGIR